MQCTYVDSAGCQCVKLSRGRKPRCRHHRGNLSHGPCGLCGRWTKEPSRVCPVCWRAFLARNSLPPGLLARGGAPPDDHR